MHTVTHLNAFVRIDGGEKLRGGQEDERICDQLPDNEPHRV